MGFPGDTAPWIPWIVIDKPAIKWHHIFDNKFATALQLFVF